VRRVRRFHSTTVGLHSQEVREFLGDSLAVCAGTSRVNGNSVLPEQAGQVHGLREILRPFSRRHIHWSCCDETRKLYALVCDLAIGILPGDLREKP
jgi:hypothetical protein